MLVTDFFWTRSCVSETWSLIGNIGPDNPVSAWTHITQTVTTIMVISGLCYIALIVTRSTFVAFDS